MLILKDKTMMKAITLTKTFWVFLFFLSCNLLMGNNKPSGNDSADLKSDTTCMWTINLVGSYGDQISWQLYNTDSTVLLSGGQYSYGFNDTLTIETADTLSFYIETLGTWLDNVVIYYISNGNGIASTGTLTGGQEITIEGLTSDKQSQTCSQGCLDAFYGAYPESTYEPLYAGVFETIFTGNYAGQYSAVHVLAGKEYTFASSIETDIITIGDENGENILTFGTGSLVWKAPSNQIVRFYTHADAYCNYLNVFRSHLIKCGETPPPPAVPDYECYQGDGLASNNFENSFSIDPLDVYRNVDDILVEDGIIFTIQYLRLNIATWWQPVSNISFIFLADSNGFPTDSVVFKTDYIVPDSQIVRGFNSIGFPVYEISVSLPKSIDLLPGRYWLLPRGTTGFGSAYWEMTTLGSNGGNMYTSTDGGAWEKDARNYQAVFFAAGECNQIQSISGASISEVAYFPDPVVDQLTIDSKNPISSVNVYNLMGKRVEVNGINININQAKVDMSLLTPGIYFIQLINANNKVETFKVIKS